MSDKIVTQISVGLDPESLKKLKSQVSSAIGEGGSGAIDKIQKILGELGKSVRTAMSAPGGDKIFGNAISQIEEMQRILAESSKMPKGMAKSFGTMTSVIEKSAAAASKLVVAEKEVAKAETGVAAAVTKATEAVKQSGAVSEKVSRKKVGDTKKVEQAQNALSARIKTLENLSASSAMSSSNKAAQAKMQSAAKAYNHYRSKIKEMIALNKKLESNILSMEKRTTSRLQSEINKRMALEKNFAQFRDRQATRAALLSPGLPRTRGSQKPLFPDRAGDAFTNVALYGMAAIPLMYGRQAARQSVERDASIRNAMSIGFDPGKDSGIYSSYEKLSGSIFDIAQSSGIAASEVDKLAMSMAQAGLAGKESERILSAMARASKLSFGTMDSDSAIAGFNALKNTFYKDVKDPAEKATLAIQGLEKAIFIANKSAANPQQLIEAFTRIGSVGKMAGYTADETMTWLTSAGEMSGLTPQAMATTLNRTLARTRAPEIVQKLKAIGIDMRREEDNSFKSIKEIVADLGKKRKEMSLDDQQKLDLVVAGNVQFSRWAPLMEALDTIEEKIKSLGEADDAIKRQIEMSNEGLGVSFTRLWNSIEQGFLSAVDESSGIYMFKKAIDAVSESLGAMADNSGKHLDTMLMYIGAFAAGATAKLAFLSPYIAFAATLKAGYDLAVDYKDTEKVKRQQRADILGNTDRSNPLFQKYFDSKSMYGPSIRNNEALNLQSISYLLGGNNASKRQMKTSYYDILDGDEGEKQYKAMIASKLLDEGQVGKFAVMVAEAIEKYKPQEIETDVEAGGLFVYEMRAGIAAAAERAVKAEERFVSSPQFIANEQTKAKVKTLGQLNQGVLGALALFKEYKDETTIAGKHDPVALAGIEAMLSEYKGMYAEKGSKAFSEYMSANKIGKLDPSEEMERQKIRKEFVAAFGYINSAKNALELKSIRAGKRASASNQKAEREYQELLNRQKKELANKIDAFFGGYIKDIVEQYSPEEIERFGAISKPIGASPSQVVGILISDTMTAISQNPASLLESIDVVSIYENVSEAIGKAVGESIMLNAGEGSIATEQMRRMLQVGKFALGLGLGAGTYGGTRGISYGGAGAMGLNALGISKGVVSAAKAVDANLKTKLDDEIKEEEKRQEKILEHQRELLKDSNKWLEKISKKADALEAKTGIESSFEDSILSMAKGGGASFSGIKDSLLGGIFSRIVSSKNGGMLGSGSMQAIFSGLDIASRFGAGSGAAISKINNSWTDTVGYANERAMEFSGRVAGVSTVSNRLGDTLSRAGTGQALAAGAKAGTGSLIGSKAAGVITGIGTIMTVWAAIEAVNSIANAIGIGGTRVRHDDRELVNQQNERLSQSYGAMMSSATSGQYVSSDIRRAYGYKPDYSAYYEETSDRGFIDKLFKGKDTHYYSNNAALASIAKIEKMQYESIMTAGELEIDYADKEIKMQREKLNRMETVIGLQKEMVTKGEEVDLASLAQKEIEAMSLRHAMFTDAIDKGYAAIGTTDVGMTIRGITKKYDPTGLGTTANGGIDPRALSRYFNDYTTGGVYGTTIGGGGFNVPVERRKSYFYDALKSAGALDFDDGSLPYAIEKSLAMGGIGTLLTGGGRDGEEGPIRLRTAGVAQLESALSSGKIKDTQSAIETMVKELELFGSKSPIADEMAEIIAIAEDIVTLQRAMLQAQINQSVTMIESSDYLANIESSNKTITDIEKATNISYASFAEKLSQGKIGAIGDDKWTYRNQAIDQRIAAISTFSGGAFSGTDLMQNLYNASFIDRGIGMMTGKTEEEQKYVKQLINELASAVSGMFGAYTDKSSAANNEDAKMYEVGSSGKYYITQNFTVESTYFGGSQAEAVQFLKFLSKAWNDSGSKNTTQRLF